VEVSEGPGGHEPPLDDWEANLDIACLGVVLFADHDVFVRELLAQSVLLLLLACVELRVQLHRRVLLANLLCRQPKHTDEDALAVARVGHEQLVVDYERDESAGADPRQLSEAQVIGLFGSVSECLFLVDLGLGTTSSKLLMSTALTSSSDGFGLRRALKFLSMSPWIIWLAYSAERSSIGYLAASLHVRRRPRRRTPSRWSAACRRSGLRWGCSPGTGSSAPGS
jgi:hypothetical protein